MKKKKLNLEISEIGPRADKSKLATGLPGGPCGPCGPCGFEGIEGIQATMASNGAASGGWADNPAHGKCLTALDAIYDAANTEVPGQGTKGGGAAFAVAGTIAVGISCIVCHLSK